MKRKTLTQAQAWTIVDLVFKRPLGMCKVIYDCCAKAGLTKKDRNAMYAAIVKLAGEEMTTGYLWDCTPEGDWERVKFARTMQRRCRRKK